MQEDDDFSLHVLSFTLSHCDLSTLFNKMMLKKKKLPAKSTFSSSEVHINEAGAGSSTSHTEPLAET